MNAIRRLNDRVPGHPIAKVVVPIIAVVLVATAVWGPTGGPQPSASPRPTSSPVAVASPTPQATDAEPWADLDLPPAAILADLEPRAADAAGVATSSAFTLRSRGSIPALDLAAGVRAEPELEFRIRAGDAPDEAVLEPTTPLYEGMTYRFRLYAPDGSLGGSWAYRTQQPLQVVGTLPGNRATGVPFRTGIEVTFDQDGTTGFAARFSIEPAVSGRFEQHDRTWAFVPDQPLAAATAYRVTIQPGVAIEGSDQVLEEEYVFRFETAAATGSKEPAVRFASPVSALRPGERPALAIYGGNDEDEDPTFTSLPVEIYRLPDLAATVAAVERLTGQDSWLQASADGRVSTDGLRRVAAVEARVVGSDYEATVVSVPIDLDPGAYLLVVPRQVAPAQHLLQVSNIGAYALTTEAGTVVWVNNLRTVEPVAGAVVGLADGSRLERTGADGLARFATPSELLPRSEFDDDGDWTSPAASIITVTAPDGRWLVAALGVGYWRDGFVDNVLPSADAPWNRYWLTFQTDRYQYRQTDVIRAWGLIRERSDRSVPSDLEVRVRAVGGRADTAIARVAVTPTGRGTFAVELPIRDLPRDEYLVTLNHAGREVASTWIHVTEIRKPGYQLAVETNRLAYLDGDRIRVTVRGSFFDGTPLAGIDLNVTTRGATTQVTTDADGIATVTLDAHYGHDRPEGWDTQAISVRPARPEEADITGAARVIVFASRAWLGSTSRLEGTTLVSEGTAITVDLAAMTEAGISASTAREPTGPPLAGATVRATVVRLDSVRTQVGTEYDYIEKAVVPVYDYDVIRRSVGTFRATTAADGTFRFEIPVPSARDEYEVVLSTTDAAGRRILLEDGAWPRDPDRTYFRAPYLISTGCGASSTQVSPGELATLTFHNGDGTTADEGRFLFLVGTPQQIDAVLTPDSSFERRMTEAELPGFHVRGIQLTGRGYAAADAYITVDPQDMRIRVRLDPDRAGYRPGDRVTVGITTTTLDGSPVAADVIVRGLDEKLFAIGAATEDNPLGDLYRFTGAGFLQSFASHRFGGADEGGCGATGGRDDREVFGDVVTYQLVRTGADGRAVASFTLLDDLTSWRLSATAVTGNLRAGSGTVLVPVSLPFFVEPTLAPEYLVGEAPVLRLRAYGAGLRAGDAVRFTVSSTSLGMAETTVEGSAFEALRVALPALPAGDHAIRISGQGPRDALRDSLVRTIHVIPSRLTGLVVHHDSLVAGYEVRGGPGLTDYLVLDAGRGSLIPILQELADATSARFDRGAAATEARRLLIDEFGFDPDRLPEAGFEGGRYQRGLVGILPYASGDLELSAMAALVVPRHVDEMSLREELVGLVDGLAVVQANRERRVVALAGLAGLGEDVLAELRVLATQELTIRESLWLALGLAALGDENGARAIERALLDAHGQRLGGWVRLAAGTTLEQTIEASRLLLVLAARLGEPFARDVAAYLADHPSRERALALEQLAYVQAGLERLPRAAGRVAWTLDGERREETLEPGGSLHLVLTAQQRAGLRLEPLAGELAVVTSWVGEDAVLPSGAEATIVRQVEPAGNAPDDRLVRVTIRVSFGALATGGCWQVTDLVPSGLAALPQRDGWDWEGDPVNALGPYEIDAQRVSWCLSPRQPERTLAYVARVVSPGTYRWEPAVIQSVNAPELGAATEASTFTIR